MTTDGRPVRLPSGTLSGGAPSYSRGAPRRVGSGTLRFTDSTPVATPSMLWPQTPSTPFAMNLMQPCNVWPQTPSTPFATNHGGGGTLASASVVADALFAAAMASTAGGAIQVPQATAARPFAAAAASTAGQLPTAGGPATQAPQATAARPLAAAVASTAGQAAAEPAMQTWASLSSPVCGLAHSAAWPAPGPPLAPGASWADAQPGSAAGCAETAAPSSRGSLLHDGSGRCSPCAWHYKPQGCQLAAACPYCHVCPQGELKRRKKAKVAALRQGQSKP